MNQRRTSRPLTPVWVRDWLASMGAFSFSANPSAGGACRGKLPIPFYVDIDCNHGKITASYASEQLDTKVLPRSPGGRRRSENVSLKPFSPDEELNWSDLGFLPG